MKSLFISCVTSLLSGLLLNAQSLAPIRIGSGAADNGTCVTTDGAGNKYLGLTYSMLCDGDPGPGFDSLKTGATYSNGTQASALVSLDASGNFRWHRNVQILTSNMATVSIADAEFDLNGDLWVFGSARGHNLEVDIDPSATFQGLGTGSQFQDNGFVWKLDTAGNVLKVLSFPVVFSNSMFRPIEIVISPQNEIMLVTTFSNSFDADAGPGVNTLTSAGYLDYAIMRYDVNGNFVNAFSYGSGDYEHECHLKFDHTGNIYVTGVFCNTVDFDPGAGVFNLSAPGSYYGYGNFVVKLDANCNFIWAVKMSGASSATVWNKGIQISAGNCPLIYGYYNGNPDWNPGPGAIYHPSVSINDLYLVQLDTNGLFMSWHSLPGLSFQNHPEICALPDGEFIMYGQTFRNMFDMDPGTGVYPLISQGNNDMFAMGLDSSFQMKWIKVIRGPSVDIMTDLKPSGNGHFLFAGAFKTSVTIGNSTLISAGVEDACFGTFYAPNNSVHGKIYHDMNSNIVFDSADVIVQLPVFGVANDTLIPGVNQVSAEYAVYMNDSGTATVTYLNPPAYYTLNTNQYVVPFGNLLNQSDSLNDFILTPIPGITDFGIDLEQMNGVQVNRQSDYRIVLNNAGTTTCGGVLTMYFDTILSYQSSDSVPVTITADSLVWIVDTLAPWETFATWVSFDVSGNSSNMGDTVLTRVQFVPSLSDSTVADNTDSIYQVVTNAYDPNFKETAQSIELDSSFDQTGKYLNYTIHFQNMGTASTQKVIVVDSIDTQHLDCSSFEFLQASHACGVFMNAGGEVVFTFNNCVLTPYYNSEFTSRGFVSFRIRLKSNFTEGDTVKNNADIYFDTNPAVITDDAVNYIPVPISAGTDNSTPANDMVVVFPNPASHILNIHADGFSVYTIYDFSGRKIEAGKISSGGNMILDVSGLANGIYFVELIGEGVSVKQKFIVQRD